MPAPDAQPIMGQSPLAPAEPASFEDRLNQGPIGQGYGVQPKAVAAMRSGLLRQAPGGVVPLPSEAPPADTPAQGSIPIMGEAPAAVPRSAPPLSFGPLPGTQPRASSEPAVSSPAGAQEPEPDGGGLLSALGRPNVYNTLLGIGQGLLTTKGFGPGIAAGTAYASRLGKEQAATDLAQAEYGLKARKLQQEAAGQNATVSLLVGKGIPKADAEAMVLAAGAGNREALNNALQNVVPKNADVPFGWTKRPDGSFGPSTGGPQDPATLRAHAEATAAGAAAGKPDEPFTLGAGSTRYDAAGNPIVAAPEKRPENFDVETKLRGEFSKGLGTFADVHDGYGRVIAATRQREANPSAVSPASDIGLIFGYMKMLDPGSVVREGEYATAKNAGGIDDRVRNAYNKALSGEFLTDGQRRDFLGQAAGLYDTARKTAEGVASRYRGLAPQYGANPDRVTYLPEAPVAPQIRATTRSAPASDGAIRALQSDPTLRDQFDAKYGRGAADRYLGGR